MVILLEQQDLAELMCDVLYTSHLPLLRLFAQHICVDPQARSALMSASLVALLDFLPAPMHHLGSGASAASHPSPGGEQRQRAERRTHRGLRRIPPQRHAVQV